MKLKVFSISLLVLLAVGGGFFLHVKGKHPRLKILVERSTMSNSSRVTLTLWLKGGQLLESKPAQSAIANQAWLMGGKEGISPAEMKALLGNGMSILSSNKDPYQPSSSKVAYLEWKISCSWENCKRHLPTLLAVLKNPAFHQNAIDEAKTEFLARAKEYYELPFGPVFQAALTLTSAQQPGVGIVPRTNAIQNINRADLLEYSTKVLRNPVLVVGVEGNVEEADVRTLIESQWKNAKVASETPADFSGVSTRTVGSGVYFFPIPKSPALYMGVINSPTNTDFLYRDKALWARHKTFSGIFQYGAFIGRLVKTLRFEKALSYSPIFYEGLDFEMPNLMATFSDGNLNQAEIFFDSFYGVIEGLTKETSLLTESELQDAKDVVMSNAVFECESTAKTRLSSRMFLALHGYPETFCADAYAQVGRTTLLDMQSFIAKNWGHPRQLPIVIVGPPEFLQDGKTVQMADLLQAFALKHQLGPVKTMPTKITWE